MSATKTIRIPLIIDANGKWCAYGWTSVCETQSPDWAMIDEIADNDNPLVCPQRYIVTVTLDVPTERETTAQHVEKAPSP